MTVRFIDRPCGYGKTTDMLNGLDPGELYLIVVPTLTEVERVLKARPDMNFVAPDEEDGTMSRACRVFEKPYFNPFAAQEQ